MRAQARIVHTARVIMAGALGRAGWGFGNIFQLAAVDANAIVLFCRDVVLNAGPRSGSLHRTASSR